MKLKQVLEAADRAAGQVASWPNWKQKLSTATKGEVRCVQVKKRTIDFMSQQLKFPFALDDDDRRAIVHVKIDAPRPVDRWLEGYDLGLARAAEFILLTLGDPNIDAPWGTIDALRDLAHELREAASMPPEGGQS